MKYTPLNHWGIALSIAVFDSPAIRECGTLRMVSLTFPKTMLENNHQRSRLDLVIRPFTPEDATQVSELICRCLREVNIQDYTSEQIERMIPGFSPDTLPARFAGCDTALALLNNTIIGIGLLATNEIRTMFVSPDHHGHGVGKSIMQHLERLALQRGIPELIVFSSVTARDFYASQGYHIVETTEHPIAGTRYKAVKSLPASL